MIGDDQTILYIGEIERKLPKGTPETVSYFWFPAEIWESHLFGIDTSMNKSFTAKCVTCSKVERVDKKQDHWPNKYKYVKHVHPQSKRLNIGNIGHVSHLQVLEKPGSTEIPNEETSHQGICLLPRLHTFTCCQQLRVVFKDDGNYNMGWKSPVLSRVI